MGTLQVDDHEYAYLKAITLFSGDQAVLLRNDIGQFHEKALQELRNYVTHNSPQDRDRLSR